MTSPSVPRVLRIVVVNAAPASDAGEDALRTGLLDAGYEIVAVLPLDRCLPERVAELQPDLIVVDSPSDARAVLAPIAAATRDTPRPVVLFTEDMAPASVEAALAAGVSAYVVAGLLPERVKPVLDVALARFRREQKLADELQDARRRLAERKLVERAKGLLMARNRMSEDQAYQKLRSMAMNRNLKLAEVAQRILDVEDLL